MMDDAGTENNPGESETAEAAPGVADGEAARELTPEEQMAKFEEALKDEDWGHQPC